MKCRGGELWLMVTVRVPLSFTSLGSAAAAASSTLTASAELEGLGASDWAEEDIPGLEHPERRRLAMDTAAAVTNIDRN